MRAKRLAFNAASIPDWCLRRPKPFHQAVCDFLAAPVRMALLPDAANERLHLTSLRAERFAAVLPHLQGRVLDVGAGDNALIKLYRAKRARLASRSRTPRKRRCRCPGLGRRVSNHRRCRLASLRRRLIRYRVFHRLHQPYGNYTEN